jgi:hypothetical protein
MLLHVSVLLGHLQATLIKNSNSLYANHIILRYVVDVPSYLFELRLFLCHIRCVVLPCLPVLELILCDSPISH